MKKLIALAVFGVFVLVGISWAKEVEVVDKGQEGGGINFRTAPRKNSSTLDAHYPVGTRFTYLGQASNNYIKVKKGNKVGYVHSNLVKFIEEKRVAPKAPVSKPAPAKAKDAWEDDFGEDWEEPTKEAKKAPDKIAPDPSKKPEKEQKAKGAEDDWDDWEDDEEGGLDWMDEE